MQKFANKNKRLGSIIVYNYGETLNLVLLLSELMIENSDRLFQKCLPAVSFSTQAITNFEKNAFKKFSMHKQKK